MVRLAIDKDGAKLSVDQFRNKYGRDFVKREKATKMCDFFAFVPKKAKQSRTANTTIEATHIILDEIPNAPNISNTSSVRMNVCGGAISTLDCTYKAIQKGLELLQRFYHCVTVSGVIKVIEGTEGVYSMFHLNCDDINVQ